MVLRPPRCPLTPVYGHLVGHYPLLNGFGETGQFGNWQIVFVTTFGTTCADLNLRDDSRRKGEIKEKCNLVAVNWKKKNKGSS